MTGKTILIYALKVLGIILGIVIIYVILGLLIPFIPVSAKNDGEKKDIPIYIYTNGVHTDIVMPVRNDMQDWSLKIPFATVKSKKQITII